MKITIDNDNDFHYHLMYIEFLKIKATFIGGINMIIVTNTTKITKGNGHKLIERFNKVGKVETMSGFLGLEVLLTQNTVDYDEVTISTRLECKRRFPRLDKELSI